MKLKPIIASMIMLGGLAGRAFAALPSEANVAPQLDIQRAKIAKMEAVIEQNSSGGWQQPSDWFNRITISGQANVDALFSDRVPTTFAKGHTSDLNLSNANFYVDALLNDWTRFHGALVYQDLSFNAERRIPTLVKTFDRNLDEGYVTIGNFARSPFYFRAGRQYVPFGDYQRYPIFETFTQLLTETQATAAVVGWVHPCGYNASIYAFSGLPQATDPGSRTRIRNFGAHIGAATSYDVFAYKLGLDYLRNMADVNYITSGLLGTYVNKVGGLSFNADFATGPFDAGFRIVSALQDFFVGNVPYVDNGKIKGAKPGALDVSAGYSFPVICHTTRLGVGFQASREANNVGFFGIPKQRYLVNYTVNVSRWTDIGVEVYHDRGYGANKFLGKGGTGSHVTVGDLRLAVKFA